MKIATITVYKKGQNWTHRIGQNEKRVSVKKEKVATQKGLKLEKSETIKKGRFSTG